MVERAGNNPKEQEPQLGNFSLGITGERHGVGSSTISQILAEILGLDYYYAGMDRRLKAVELGFATSLDDEAGLVRFEQEYVSIHPDVDAKLDKKMSALVNQQPSVFEGKSLCPIAKAGRVPKLNTTTGQWELETIPQEGKIPVFTVLLTCDEREAAKRILLRKKLEQEKIDPRSLSDQEIKDILEQIKQNEKEDVEEQIRLSNQRISTSRQNWENLYHLSELEKGEGAYNWTINTTNLTRAQVVEIVLYFLAEKSLISKEQYEASLVKLEQIIKRSNSNSH